MDLTNVLGVFLGSGDASAAWGVPLGARSHVKIILGCVLRDLGLYLGTLEWHFGGHFGAPWEPLGALGGHLEATWLYLGSRGAKKSPATVLIATKPK